MKAIVQRIRSQPVRYALLMLALATLSRCTYVFNRPASAGWADTPFLSLTRPIFLPSHQEKYDNWPSRTLAIYSDLTWSGMNDKSFNHAASAALGREYDKGAPENPEEFFEFASMYFSESKALQPGSTSHEIQAAQAALAIWSGVGIERVSELVESTPFRPIWPDAFVKETHAAAEERRLEWLGRTVIGVDFFGKLNTETAERRLAFYREYFDKDSVPHVELLREYVYPRRSLTAEFSAGRDWSTLRGALKYYFKNHFSHEIGGKHPEKDSEIESAAIAELARTDTAYFVEEVIGNRNRYAAELFKCAAAAFREWGALTFSAIGQRDAERAASDSKRAFEARERGNAIARAARVVLDRPEQALLSERVINNTRTAAMGSGLRQKDGYDYYKEVKCMYTSVELGKIAVSDSLPAAPSN